MLAEGAVINNPSDVTRIIYCGGFGIVETLGQRQFAKPNCPVHKAAR